MQTHYKNDNPSVIPDSIIATDLGSTVIMTKGSTMQGPWFNIFNTILQPVIHSIESADTGIGRCSHGLIFQSWLDALQRVGQSGLSGWTQTRRS